MKLIKTNDEKNWLAAGKNLPRYNQMNINVATWARIIKRSQPSNDTASSISSSSSSLARPGSVSSSSLRPLPLNLTSPTPVTSTTSSLYAPAVTAPTAAVEAVDDKLLEAPGEKPQSAGTSAARPLSLSLSSSSTSTSAVDFVASQTSHTPPTYNPLLIANSMIPAQQNWVSYSFIVFIRFYSF